MKYKEGVTNEGLHWTMRKVDKVVEDVWLAHGQEAVVTSTLGGKHTKWSWHRFGCAEDFRTRDPNFPRSWEFDEKTLEEIRRELARRLPPPYQVVVESDHIHIEFDPVAYNMEWF